MKKIIYFGLSFLSYLSFDCLWQEEKKKSSQQTQTTQTQQQAALNRWL